MEQTTITREFLPWLKVLNEYCDEDLITEYNELDLRRKPKLYDLL
jgi:hypothetical protein